ncbi:NAD(P)-dependent oxidoreductase [Clostridiales bacterium COT073_COT-073]|nr:NAD(P)-dependent oxidoreductase [Clostridiales bacterium COT073_COT-073]
MKVLVTGATGFLGKYIIAELTEYGYEVIAVGRNQQIGKGLENEKVSFVSADFTDIYSLAGAFRQKPEMVVHAGALSTVWGRWTDFYRSNVLGTENVLKLCAKTGVKRLVYISSPSIYACGQDQINIKEYTPKENHLTNYIKSKLLSEQRIKAHPEVESVILRPRGLIGVGDTSVIPRVLNISRKLGVPLFQEGKHWVDLTCVENAALAVRLALESSLAAGQIYNITNGQPRQFRQLMDEFLAAMGIKARYLRLNDQLFYGFARGLETFYRYFHIYQEPLFTVYTYYLLRYSQTLNIDKARAELNYHPKMTLSEGIQKYAKANRKH